MAEGWADQRDMAEWAEGQKERLAADVERRQEQMVACRHRKKDAVHLRMCKCKYVEFHLCVHSLFLPSPQGIQGEEAAAAASSL
jgi:hypothetical protein